MDLQSLGCTEEAWLPVAVAGKRGEGAGPAGPEGTRKQLLGKGWLEAALSLWL